MTEHQKTDPITMEWLMEDAITPNAELSMAKMTVGVNQTSELHSHPNCTEAIHILSGTVEQRCGDDWVTLSEGQTCLILKGFKHQTRNIGNERAVLMLAYSCGTRIYKSYG